MIQVAICDDNEFDLSRLRTAAFLLKSPSIPAGRLCCGMWRRKRLALIFICWIFTSQESAVWRLPGAFAF